MVLKDFNSSLGSLDNMNALFPKEYRVEINTNKYNELMQQRLLYKCNNCNEEINQNEIELFDIIIPLVDSILAKTQTEKVWKCSKCNKLNEFVKTETVQEKMVEPYYLKVVYSNPTKQDGIIDHSSFDNKFTSWFWTFLKELEYQIGLYRAEYRAQNGSDMEGDDIFKDDGRG